MKEALEHKKKLLTENVTREPLSSAVSTAGSRDLRALGKLSVFFMRMILISAKACFLPTVKAAPPPQDPSKPAPMKYKDLPLYECPHFVYKDFLDQKHSKCPDKKILHSMLLPHVSKFRKEACSVICRMRNQVVGIYCNTTKSFVTTFRQTKAYCRCPAHDSERKAIMVTAPILGGLVACGGKPTRLFGATAAAAAAGALCYPEPTDKVFKTVLAFVAGKALVLFNYVCSGSLMPKQPTCPAEYPEMPPPPAKVMDNKCPTKK